MFTKEIINQYSDKIVKFFDVILKIPKQFKYNIELLKLCLENNYVNLALSFDDTLFTKEILTQHRDKIEKEYFQFLPISLGKSSDYLEICLENNNYELAQQFDKLLFTEKIIKEYGEKIAKNFEALPSTLSTNVEFFKLCLKNDNLRLAQQFDELLFTEEIIKEYGEKIVKNFNRLPSTLSTNVELLKLCLKNDNFRLAQQFDELLFTEEIIKEYGEKIAKNFKHLPVSLKENLEFLELCFDNNNFQLIEQFNETPFTKEIIDKYKEKIVQHFITNKYTIPQNLKNNVEFLKLCFDNNNFDLIKQFDSSLFTEEIISKYSKEIYEILKFVRPLKEDKKLLELCLENGNYRLIEQFYESLFTEEIITKYGKQIIENLTDILPNLKKNIYLLKICLENENYGLAQQFSDSIFTEEIVTKYGEKISKNFINIPSSLKSNKYLLKLCFDNNNFELIKQFNVSIFTGEIISEYEEMIYNNIMILSNIYENKEFLKLCLENGYYKLAQQFDYAFTEEIIEKYSEKIAKNFNKLPYTLKNNKTYLKICLENNNYDLVQQFDGSLFTKEIITKYGDKISKNFNKLPYVLKNNEIFLIYCLENDNFELAKQFDTSLFTEEIIEKYGKKISKNFNHLPQELIYNEKSLILCLENNNYELAQQFAASIFTEEIIKQYGDKIAQNFYQLPYTLKNNKTYLKICLENNNYKLAQQFDGSIFTEEIIKEYGDKIAQNFNKLPYTLENNKTYLKICLENNNYELAQQFAASIFTEEIIEEYGEKIAKNFNMLPSTLSTNVEFLKLCLENDNFNLVQNFYAEAFTKEIIEQYSKKITEHYKVNTFYNSLPSCLYRYSELLKIYLENDNFNLVKNFYAEAFTKEILEEYGEKILKNFKNLPLGLRNNLKFLTICLENDNYELAQQFDGSIFTEGIIKEYGEKILKNFKNLPSGLKANLKFLKLCLENENYELAQQFDSSIFTKEIIEQYDEKILKCLSEDFIIKNRDNPYLFKLVIDKNYYNSIELFGFDEKIMDYENNDLLNLYSEILGISKELLKYKLDYLYTKNNEIFQTLSPILLSSKFECVSMKELEKLSLHPDIQGKIFLFNSQEIKILSRIMEFLDNEKYDFSVIIYHIIQNISFHKNLIKKINIDSLTEEQLKNLIFILSKEIKVLIVVSQDDLFDDKFEILRKEYEEKISLMVENDKIDIETLRETILYTKFNLSLKEAQFICSRYCKNIEELEKSDLNKDILNILKQINNIFKCQDVEELKTLYTICPILNGDFYSAMSLESSIRKEYAKMYNKTLYQLNENHLLDENHYLYKNEKTRHIYEKIKEASYNGKKPQFYIIDGDFNLQIHALGAYNKSYVRPENFKDDWERPLIINHGICTSYIGNNQIANARISHPVYGFSEYEESALLCAGNYDLVSNSINTKYAISLEKPYDFLPPKEMINNTRHTHNEMVLERRCNINGKSFKRMPNYVVYFVDDINNEANFDMNNTLYNETVQAAIDNDVPIIIVDRLKYAKSERKKCDDLINEFYNTLDVNYLENAFLTFFNNAIGCINYKKSGSEYHKYFDKDSFDKIYNEVLNFIKSNSYLEYQTELLVILKSILMKEENGENFENLSIVNNINELDNLILTNNQMLTNNQESLTSKGKSR